MSPIVQDVYLMIISNLDNEHLNILLKMVSQKPKGIIPLSKGSPEIFRKKIIECLQKKSNRDNIFTFIIKSGLHDIVRATQVRYDKLDMSNFETYLKELKKQTNIPAMQGILFIIENGGISRVESFFMNSKENVTKFIDGMNNLDSGEKNNLDDNKLLKNANYSLEKDLDQIKLKYSELKKMHIKSENKNNELKNEINSLKQKSEMDTKNKDSLISECTIRLKEMSSLEIEHKSMMLQKNEKIRVQEEIDFSNKSKINQLEKENQRLIVNLTEASNKYDILVEEINKKRILLLGDANGVDLSSFSDKYFDVISVSDLDIKTFNEIHEKNRYDEIWIIDFQIPRSLQKELKRAFPNQKFEQIKDNSAFR